MFVASIILKLDADPADRLVLLILLISNSLVWLVWLVGSRRLSPFALPSHRNRASTAALWASGRLNLKSLVEAIRSGESAKNLHLNFLLQAREIEFLRNFVNEVIRQMNAANTLNSAQDMTPPRKPKRRHGGNS